MTEKPQFDAFLGGSQTLPSEANILKLASARANEIAAMTYSIENPQQTKLVFQKLPLHMRRRIMSHNAKRMPRRLREIHIRQMSKSGLPPKSKRPSRKWRRRPGNLISEYKRRQRNRIWLETHVWHAKRFKIVDKWGYKIPYHSNNRCFRSSYRAVAKHCLIQDISYYSCLELQGPVESLVQTLNQHCDPSGLSFAAKSYSQGNREGTLMFFEKNGFPARPIGAVNFIWRPGSSGIRTIWIWAHPSFYPQVLAEIAKSFAFHLDPDPAPAAEYSSDDGKFRIILLRNSLNRFRLHGPLSLRLITEALRLPGETGRSFSGEKADPESDVEILSSTGGIIEGREAEKMEIEGAGSERKDSRSWDAEYYADCNNAQSFRVQKEVFQLLKDLKSPSQLPPCCVMAFTVLDPRFFVPKQRTKAQTSVSEFETIPVPPTLANISPIWESEIRKSTVENFRTTNEINELRSGNLVPGVNNDLEYDENSIDKIPVLFIQRPGSRCEEKGIGFSSGIDLIFPSGWANPFWTSFILRCAKPGGLRESRSIIFENLSLNSPDFNPPDTEAYAKEALGRKLLLLEKYFRFPPNRRSNYVKLGISSPFYCEWNLLVKEWTGSERFYVMRDKRALNNLKESISGLKKSAKPTAFDETLFKETNCLVTVKISIEQKGCPDDFALISLPSDEDMEKFERDRSWGGPTARILKDGNESERKKLRRGHLALLRRLRRQRIRQREKNENSKGVMDVETARKTLKSKARSVVQIQAEKMRNLYLPKCRSVRYSSDREVMGYVVKGDFSFTEAKGIGIGYVVLASIFRLIERKSDIVLIRNVKTRQYRLARVSVLV